jgi:hypothetical protein
MGIMGGNPKQEPMHYGEVMALWECSMAAKNCISRYQLFLNHAGDKELKGLLQKMLEQAKLEEQECDKLLVDHGVTPAPGLPERPQEKWEAIPVGARFADAEIGAMLTADNNAGLVACSTAMGMSIREDVGALFAKYHTEKTALGLQILQLNKKKGWLVPPPLHLKHEEELVGV